MNDDNESLFLDEDDHIESILPKSKNKGRNGPNSMLQTINPALDVEYDDLEESGRDTKLIMPIKHDIPDGAKVIGDYRVDKTLGQGTFGKVKQGYHIYTG